jgi:hypothetical protein
MTASDQDDGARQGTDYQLGCAHVSCQRDRRILHDADVYSDHTIENNGLNRRPHAHSRQPLGDGRVVVPHAAELEKQDKGIKAQSALDSGVHRGETRCTGPRSATRRIIAACNYFDIFSLDMLSLDMLSLDIWSFDMLSFFMPLSFDMLSLLMSSAKAGGAPKAKASVIAATGSSKRERTIILVLHYVVMVSIPSLPNSNRRAERLQRGKKILEGPAADRSRCRDDDQHRNRMDGKVGRRGIERMEEIQQHGRRRSRSEACHCRR